MTTAIKTAKYRLRRSEVEAVQWDETPAMGEHLKEWTDYCFDHEYSTWAQSWYAEVYIGGEWHPVNPGNYIIRNGDHLTLLTEEKFHLLYEPVD